jgi:hypothetical protein
MKHTGFRYSIFLVALTILGVSAIAYGYLYTKTGSLVDETLAARAALKGTQAARLQGTEIIQLQLATAERRADLKKFFVPAENAVAVIQAIESIGDASGASVNISSINATAPTDADKVGHVSASVDIDGTWKQVMQAIALFETLPYDRSMNALSLRSSGGADPRWHAGFSLTVGTISTK